MGGWRRGQPGPKAIRVDWTKRQDGSWIRSDGFTVEPWVNRRWIASMDGTEKGRIFAYSPVHNEYEMRIWTTAKAARAWADTDRPLGPIDEAATAGDLLDLLAELDWVE